MLGDDDGQLRDDFSLDVVVDQLWGACYHRLLLDEPLSVDFADELVHNALHGATPARRAPMSSR